MSSTSADAASSQATSPEFAACAIAGPPRRYGGRGSPWPSNVSRRLPRCYSRVKPACRECEGVVSRGATCVGPSLDRGLVPVAGPDPHDRVDRGDPDLAVPDTPGRRGLGDHVHDLLRVVRVEDDLDAHLGHQGDVVLRAAVDLGVALLPPVAADLTHCHPRDTERLEGDPDVLPLVRLDHRGDELHASAPSVALLLTFAAARPPEPPSTEPPRPSKSYADSPCSAKSMPSTSASAGIRQPIV